MAETVFPDNLIPLPKLLNQLAALKRFVKEASTSRALGSKLEMVTDEGFLGDGINLMQKSCGTWNSIEKKGSAQIGVIYEVNGLCCP
jgi:hypothetical protein